MNEPDVIPAARAKVAERLADARAAGEGLAPHPDVAAAVTPVHDALRHLADALAAAGRAEKIEP